MIFADKGDNIQITAFDKDERMKEHKRKYKIILIFSGILVLCTLMQFPDSYSTELYSKLQSFYIDEFILSRTDMDYGKAAGLLNAIMLPCYILSVLAPVVRVAADRFGKEIVGMINLGVMAVGLWVCICSKNLVAFAIGNGIITFAVSLDIHFMYIARDIPKKFRGTARGLVAGVGAVAAVVLPICRNHLVGQKNYGWRSLYYAGMIMCAVSIMGIAVFCIQRKHAGSNKVRRPKGRPTEKIRLKSVVKENLGLLVFEMIVGIATAGITYYNEPMLSEKIKSEEFINVVLAVQPIVTFVLMLLIGAVSDMLGRKRTMLMCLAMCVVTVFAYVFGIKFFPNKYLLGICWGGMVAFYFSIINLTDLTVMEHARRNAVGKTSAVATYAYGVGDAIGLVLAAVLVRWMSMGAVKIVLAAVPLAAAAVVFIRYRASRSSSS